MMFTAKLSRRANHCGLYATFIANFIAIKAKDYWKIFNYLSHEILRELKMDPFTLFQSDQTPIAHYQLHFELLSAITRIFLSSINQSTKNGRTCIGRNEIFANDNNVIILIYNLKLC